jgi:hypothetical protein
MTPLMRLPSLVAVCVLALAACGGGPETLPAPTTPRTLQAKPETIWVQPGQMGTISFVVLGPTGAPLAGAPVSFSIVEAADMPTQGATLVTPKVVSDARGVAEGMLTAGARASFRVRATTDTASEEVVVIVAEGLVSSVDVAPFFPPGSRAAGHATTVQILFYDNGACRTLPLRKPPTPVRKMTSVPVGGVLRVNVVSTAVSHAIIGRAVDARDAVVGLGCVDLPGPTLVTGVAVQVALPIADAGPDPTGTFMATTSLAVSPALAAASTVAAAWSDLVDCPLDPAQLWLDCAIDGLGPTSDADPLDCVPATKAGGDGALGDALGALRGAFVVGADGKPTACRGAKTAGGAVSLDAVAMGLFGAPRPAALLALEGAADDAAHLFDTLRVRSTLDVRGGATPDTLAVTHTLTDVVFSRKGRSSAVALLPLGLPELAATATAALTEDAISLPEHGFTLRLGTAARAGFGGVALAPRGLPGDAHALVAALAALAIDDDGVTNGCAALDAALCPRAGAADGCLAHACATGLDALAARLDASFTAADGDGYDLYLRGAAPLLDTHGNSLADRLGDLQLPGQAGAWAVELRPRAGRRTLAAAWEAIRVGN